MKLRELLEVSEYDLKDRDAHDIVERFKDLLTDNEGTSKWFWALKSVGSTVPVASEEEAKKIIAALTSDKVFNSRWTIDGPRYESYFKRWEVGVTDNRSYKNLDSNPDHATVNVDDTIPTTKWTDDQLYEIAEKVGHKLFDKHMSGLIWGDREGVEKTNTFRMLKELVEQIGDDAIDIANFTVSTFEFVFKPSSETGIDASDDPRYNFVTGAKRMADVDGNIYLADSTDNVHIRVIKPVIKTTKDYENIIAQELK